VTDCAVGVLKIFLQNNPGFIYSQDRSGYLTIDNQDNGTPFVRIRNDEFRSAEVFDQERCPLALLLGDAEDNPLTVNLFYSTDGGQVFSQWRAIDLVSLPNSPQAVICAAASAAAVPMKFLVQNLTANRPVEIIFLDNDADQTISPFNKIFLLKVIDQSALRLRWSRNSP